MDLIVKNLINYRKKHNLATDQAAIICGMTKEDYENVELGFDKPNKIMLVKLAAFYKIDVMQFNEPVVAENKEPVTNAQPAPKAAAKTVTANPEVKGYNFPKNTTIAQLILAVASLVWFFFFPLINETVNAFGFTAKVSLSFLDLFNGTGLTLASTIIVLIMLLYLITTSIIMLASKSIQASKFAYVNKIILLVVGTLLLSFVGYVTISLNVLLSYVYLALNIAVAVLIVVNFINTVPAQEFNARPPRVVKHFDPKVNKIVIATTCLSALVVICLAILYGIDSSYLLNVLSGIITLVLGIVMLAMVAVNYFIKSTKMAYINIVASSILTTWIAFMTFMVVAVYA